MNTKDALNVPASNKSKSSTLIVVIVLCVIAIPVALLGMLFVVGLFVFQTTRGPVDMPVAVEFSSDQAMVASDSAATEEDLKKRFDAAMNIQDPRERNSALAGLAKSAASSGNAKVTRDALMNITDPDSRNRALADSGVLLAMTGEIKEGLDLVNMISDSEIRDKALARIAKGE